MGTPLVYVITLNWNRATDTIQCIDSLMNLRYQNKRILVVDNGSEDGSPNIIREHFPNVEQIIIPSNLGFAAGFNVGIRHALNAGSKAIMIVNNDSYIAPDALDFLLDALEPNDVGITAPIIYYADAPDKIWSAGALRSPITLELKGGHGRKLTYKNIVERDFISGCGMLIKRAVFENVGLFDERFFMYYEDSDYSMRVRDTGYRIILVPQASMWHKVSLSSMGRDSPSERYLMARSSVIFYRKHATRWQILFLIPWRVGSSFKIITRLILLNRIPSAKAYIKGVWDGIKAIKNT